MKLLDFFKRRREDHELELLSFKEKQSLKIIEGNLRLYKRYGESSIGLIAKTDLDLVHELIKNYDYFYQLKFIKELKGKITVKRDYIG